jgi:DNA polymerase elongation subunit (family B)
LLAERKRVKKQMGFAAVKLDVQKLRQENIKKWKTKSREELSAEVERLIKTFQGLDATIKVFRQLQGDDAIRYMLKEQFTKTDQGKDTAKALYLTEALRFLSEHSVAEAEAELDRLALDISDKKLLVDVLNARQLIVKLSANATYGFSGVGGAQEQEEMEELLAEQKRRAFAAKRGLSMAEIDALDAGPARKKKRNKKQFVAKSYLPCPVIARSITARGRKMISDVEEFAREEYQADVIYGDTDSLFIKFPAPPPELDEKGQPVPPYRVEWDGPEGKNPGWQITISPYELKHYFKVGTEFAARATKKFFRDPVEFAPEKHLSKILLARKKGYDCETNKQTGLHTVRGDWSPLSKKFGLKVLANFTLQKRDFDAVEKVIRQQADDMVKGKIPLDDYVLSNSIGDLALYAKPKNQRHTFVAWTVRKDNPSAAFSVGDKVDYVMQLKSTGKGAKKSQNAVWVETFREDSTRKLDMAWYWESQCYKPCQSFLKAIDADRTEKLFTELSGKFALAPQIGNIFKVHSNSKKQS